MATTGNPEIQPVKNRCTFIVFGLSVFGGAFLLFQVQPLFGRFLLPWYGGSPEVWTTCMLFFQMFLLGGYAYAHLLSTKTPRKIQIGLHILLLIGAAVLAFQMIPSDSYKPEPGQIPLLKIILTAAACIGLPYFVLSSNAPLMQSWLTRMDPDIIPWRYYALSNAGSLLALISYPFIVEPFLRLQTQAMIWSIGFLIFAAACAVCGLFVLFRSQPPGAAPPIKESMPADQAPPDPKTRLLWLLLPMGASIELLAVTNKITQDIAVIPFLWILPLSLYLLSFIVCFDHQRWYKRPLFITLFILSICGIMAALKFEESMSIITVIGLYTAMLFCCCMVCHGELYRLKPSPRYLTGYYLIIATGGAGGGLFVGILAPILFNVYHELFLGILAVVLFLLWADKTYIQSQKRKLFWSATLILVSIILISSRGKRTADDQTSVENERNFFGVLTVWQENPEDPENHKYLLQHGTTFHGLQFTAPDKRSIPTAYYSPQSGIGHLLTYMPKQTDRRIGIVGLGVGTIAIYGDSGDMIRFYEINPQVEIFARKYFTYLEDSAAKIEIALGDARLTMEAENPQQYDVLAIDAFSSDSVPIHLLTKEAFEIYLSHLDPNGVLAFHISTMHLDLQSVIWKMADHLNLKSLWIEGYDNESRGALASDWILLSKTDTVLSVNVLKIAASKPYADLSEIDLWTDDHVNLLQVLRLNPLAAHDRK